MSLRQSWTTDHDSLCLGYSSGGDLALPIEELNLTVRAYNSLKRVGVHTCGELTALGERDLLAIEGFNSELAEDVKQRLADVGLSLRAAPPDGVREHSALIRHSSRASVRAVAFHPGGHLLATAGWDDTTQLWDTSAGRPVGASLPGHTDTAPLRPDSDHTRLWDTSAKRTARLWDTTTGRPVGVPLTGHTEPVHTLAFHPDGHLLATAGEDDTARLWDAITGKPVGTPLAGHIRSVHTVAFHPDGHLLATAGWDYGVRLWEVSTCRLIALFTGHTDTVWSAAFHPAGHYLATASEDGTVRLWDAAGQTVALFNHPKPVHTLAFHPDGHLLATAGHDSATRLWDISAPHP
ncbi:hypothetical protein OG884_02380 [Streptosporangium sp. NBC_01755]|nr:hypothetical protein OG884_02380 [Streptosporangium sp. NBC_01755]